MATKIKIEGEEYWFTGDGVDKSCGIAYLEQCYEDGKLNPLTCFKRNSFAHYFPNIGVIRYGKLIISSEKLKKLINKK